MPFEMLSDKPKEKKVKAFLTIEANRGMGLTIKMDSETTYIVNNLLPPNVGWDLDMPSKLVSFNLGVDSESKQILIEVCKFSKGEYDGRYVGSGYYFTSRSLAKAICYQKPCKYILIKQEGNKLYFAPVTLEDFLY